MRVNVKGKAITESKIKSMQNGNSTPLTTNDDSHNNSILRSMSGFELHVNTFPKGRKSVHLWVACLCKGLSKEGMMASRKLSMKKNRSKSLDTGHMKWFIDIKDNRWIKYIRT
jgi:hypothetical protein